MLHRCTECATLYLTSKYTRVCNPCGDYLQQRIEKLHETDNAIEWWRICGWACFGNGGDIRTSRRMAIATMVSAQPDASGGGRGDV